MSLVHDAPDGFDSVLSNAVPARRSPSFLGDAVRVVAVFLAFAGFATLSWVSFGSWGGPSFYYPSAGVTAAAMMLSRRALWPWFSAAIVAAELLVDTAFESPLWLSAAYATANVVEPVVGATIVLACCRGRPDLRRRRDFVVFVLGACLIAPIFGALIGGTASTLYGGTRWFGTAATWWSGDALGVLTMASPILLWSVQSTIVRQRPWATAGVLAAVTAASVGSFWTEFPPSILILPILAFAAFRLDMIGAAMGGAVAAFFANVMSTNNLGVFRNYGVSLAVQVALTQVFVAVIVIVAMVIAQEAAGRQRAVQEREAERRERLRLETLSRLALELSAALTPQDIGQALKHQVLNEAGAQALVLALSSADRRTLEWVTFAGFPTSLIALLGRGVPLDQPSVLTDVARLGVPISFSTSADYARAYPEFADRVYRFGAETLVGWPLSLGGQPFGVLLLVWTEPQPLNPAQLAYISAVATMVSQALVRAKIYVDEHARAAVLHSVAQPIARIDAEGLEYRTLYRPDAEDGLGGDWFSVMSLPGRRTYLGIGDVIGHGLLAVEDMAQLRSTGNAYAHMGLSPARVLTEMNRFANRQTGGEFATSLAAIYDPETSVLTYSSAGHLPALLRRAETGEVIELGAASGPMLGPFEDSVYDDGAMQICPGDVLVMYTDGLVEHRDGDPRTGIALLKQVVASWQPEALLDCKSLAEHVAPPPQADDLCLLIARFTTNSEGLAGTAASERCGPIG